jgi:hypothetical protein
MTVHDNFCGDDLNTGVPGEPEPTAGPDPNEMPVSPAKFAILPRISRQASKKKEEQSSTSSILEFVRSSDLLRWYKRSNMLSAFRPL